MNRTIKHRIARARVAPTVMWSAYVLVLAGVATTALTLIAFAGGDVVTGSVVAGATAVLFVGATALFYVEVRIGHDPALVRDIERGRRAKYLGAHRRPHHPG